MIALGLMGLMNGDFTVIWKPVPRDVPGREVLVYLCSFVSVAAGAGLFWRRAATPADETVVSWVLAAAAWVIVDSYRVPWLQAEA